MIVLITGPVRSGKSAFALELAREGGRIARYVATYQADPHDPEMVRRIEHHRAARAGMATIETNERAGPTLVETLARAKPGEVLVVDSLGTWLSAQLLALGDLPDRDPVAAAAALEGRAAALLPALDGLAADVIFVSEETGWGVVPSTALGRLFRDQLGRTTAFIAQRANQAYLVAAGYAVDLTAAGRRVNG